MVTAYYIIILLCVWRNCNWNEYPKWRQNWCTCYWKGENNETVIKNSKSCQQMRYASCWWNSPCNHQQNQEAATFAHNFAQHASQVDRSSFNFVTILRDNDRKMTCRNDQFLIFLMNTMTFAPIWTVAPSIGGYSYYIFIFLFHCSFSFTNGKCGNFDFIRIISYSYRQSWTVLSFFQWMTTYAFV